MPTRPERKAFGIASLSAKRLVRAASPLGRREAVRVADAPEGMPHTHFSIPCNLAIGLLAMLIIFRQNFRIAKTQLFVSGN